MVKDVEVLTFYFKTIGNQFKKNLCMVIDSDIKTKDIHIIEFLHSGKKTMSNLSEEMNLTPGTMTIAIDNLKKKGLVQRVYDKEDRRRVYIELTNKGLDISNLIFQEYEKISKKIISTLDKKEKDEFLLLLNKICSNIEN